MSDFRDLSSNFAVFPQLSLEQVKIASDQGFKVIVCNRPDGEDPGQLSAAQIASACQDVGLDFVHIPVSGGPNEDNVMAMKQALTQHAGPVLAYCRSGTRSTHVWALSQAMGGADPETLITAAAAAGYDLTGLAGRLQALKTSSAG